MAGRSAAKSYDYNSSGRASDDANARLAQRIGEVCLDAVASLPPPRSKRRRCNGLQKRCSIPAIRPTPSP